jgi:uncharacterized phage infection (PIP) family protein YhgE
MTSLHDTLPILEKGVPAIAPQIEAVAREAEEFRKAVAGLLEDFSEKADAAADLLAQVTDGALTPLHEGAAEHAELVERTVAAATAAVREAVQALTGGQADLRAALDGAGDAMEELGGEISEAQNRTRSAQEEAVQALDGLWRDLETEQTALGTAVEGMESAAEAVETALEDGRNTLTEAVTELGDRMETLLGQVQDRLTEAKVRLGDLRSEHEAEMGEKVSDLTQRKDQLFAELKERAEQAMRTAFEQTLEDVTNGMERLGEAAAKARESCREGREELQQQFGEIVERVPVMDGGVAQVKEAANQVGITWQ